MILAARVGLKSGWQATNQLVPDWRGPCAGVGRGRADSTAALASQAAALFHTPAAETHPPPVGDADMSR